MVYLDYNATTPLAPEALEAMLPFLHGGYGNPSSIHAAGREARAGIDDAREKLAALLGVKGHEIIFTGGGTEACNLGVLGIARAHLPRGRHLITTATEHHAVLHACQHLLHHEGYELTILPVDASGRVDPQDVARAIRADTTVVSVMHANNETGVLQPIEEISALCRERKVFFHTDAVQTFGKIPVRPADLGAAAVSIAGHKFYGPKGVGALYLRSGIATARTLHGGAQENTRRPGTENVAAIVGMVAAAEKALAEGIADQPRQAALRDRLWAGIQQVEPRAIRNGAGRPFAGEYSERQLPRRGWRGAPHRPRSRGRVRLQRVRLHGGLRAALPRAHRHGSRPRRGVVHRPIFAWPRDHRGRYRSLPACAGVCPRAAGPLRSRLMKHTQLLLKFSRSIMRSLSLVPDLAVVAEKKSPPPRKAKPSTRRELLLEALAAELLRAAGCHDLKVEVYWNSRLRTTAGSPPGATTPST